MAARLFSCSDCPVFQGLVKYPFDLVSVGINSDASSVELGRLNQQPADWGEALEWLDSAQLPEEERP